MELRYYNPVDLLYGELTDTYHLQLCDGFIYILSFRYRLENAVSSVKIVTYALHIRVDDRHQIYHRLDDGNAEIERDERCVYKSFIMNRIKYQMVNSGIDYNGFMWNDSKVQ